MLLLRRTRCRQATGDDGSAEAGQIKKPALLCSGERGKSFLIREAYK